MSTSTTYRSDKPRRRVRWAKRILVFLAVLAIFGDFIANEKPLFAKYKGEVMFPVLKSYAVDMGLAGFPPEAFQQGWKNLEYENVLWPLIPYSYSTQDRRNTGFVSPFEAQVTNGFRDWHWMGTDQLGRDVAAGLIKGTRTAFLVGLISMSIAGLIGILLGAFAGYFGDDRIKTSRLKIVFLSLGIFFGLFWAFIGKPHISESSFSFFDFLISLFIFILTSFLFWLMGNFIEKKMNLKKKVSFQLDSIVMRSIEILGSIPGLLLILAIVAVFDQASLYLVMAIIGFLFWPGIARFMRAEILKLRNSNYVESLRAMGYSDWRILFKHCIPNGIGPVLITLAFGMGAAILTEAALSFIGVGVSIEDVTWGSMLNEARRNFSAWWIAVIPGIMIFLTVGSLNVVAEDIVKE